MVECLLHIRHRFDQNLPFFDREISISNVIKINKHSVQYSKKVTDISRETDRVENHIGGAAR